MKQARICRTGLTLLCIAVLLACAAGKDQYDVGMKLSQEGNYQEAIKYLEQAIAAEPKNEDYKKSLNDLKDSLVNQMMSEADQTLQAATPVSLSAINSAKAKITEAERIDPGHPTIAVFKKKLGLREDDLVVTAEMLYRKAIASTEQKKWLKSREEFRKLQQVYPGYEDSIELMNRSARQGAQSLHNKGKALFDREDYAKSATFFRSALTLAPDHKASKDLLELAVQRDTKEYFVTQGNKFVQEQKWVRAEKAYKRALGYDPENMKLKQSLNVIDLKAADYYMRATRSQMYAGWLSKAFESYDRAANYVERSDRSDLRANLISVGTELATHTGIWADSLQEDGNYGSAWFWFEKIKEIDPEYPDIYQLVQSMEEEIIRRLKKSVGIFDFGSPSNSPDAGMIFASSLSAYLFKSADRDIKIFESEKLQSILDEMNLGHTGIVSPKTAEKIGSAYGIDVAVMGTVLRYNVDYTNYSDTKTVTYQVKETEENIEYLNWKTRNPSPTKEQLEQAPPPYIHKLIDVEKEYRVSSHRKVGFVTLSFRIVDVETGESILIDTIRGSKIVTDDTSAGVQVAGVKYDPLEILTDTELLEALTEEVVTELGKKVLQPLQTLEQAYIETGEKHLQSKNRIAAAESFADAIFDTRLKQIKDSPIGAAALNSMVDLFSNYKFQTAGQET